MKKLYLSLGIIFCFSLISFGQDSPKPAVVELVKPNPNAPEITFVEVSHDFVTLQKGDECSYEFKFKNTGKEPLILANCQASCGCTTPSCPKEPIAPGASGVIKVKYDSNRVGVFSKTVSVTSNAKNSPITLSIKGKIDGPAQEEAFPGKSNSGMTQ
jgi:hypothetical protein